MDRPTRWLAVARRLIGGDHLDHTGARRNFLHDRTVNQS
jgi:hypothetical protein